VERQPIVTTSTAGAGLEAIQQLLPNPALL